MLNWFIITLFVCLKDKEIVLLWYFVLEIIEIKYAVCWVK
jgi:hypothetical protein